MTQALPAVRRQTILDLVARREYATVTEIQAVTGASASTIHRDLARLAAAGAVRRLHGGIARAVTPPDPVTDLRTRIGHLPRALDRGDLTAVHDLLTQALQTCTLCLGTPQAAAHPVGAPRRT